MVLQSKALIELFKSIGVFGKWLNNRQVSQLAIIATCGSRYIAGECIGDCELN